MVLMTHVPTFGPQDHMIVCCVGVVLYFEFGV